MRSPALATLLTVLSTPAFASPGDDLPTEVIVEQPAASCPQPVEACPVRTAAVATPTYSGIRYYRYGSSWPVYGYGYGDVDGLPVATATNFRPMAERVVTACSTCPTTTTVACGTCPSTTHVVIARPLGTPLHGYGYAVDERTGTIVLDEDHDALDAWYGLPG